MADAKQLAVILEISANRQKANEAAGIVNRMRSDLEAVGKAGDQVSKKLAAISRESHIETLGAQYGKLSRQIGDTDRATALLVKRLKEVGASAAEIDKATNAFSRAQGGIASVGGGGNSGSGRSGLTKFGAELKALPSVQIPGLGGVGTDAVGKISMLLGALPPVALALSGALVVAGTALAVVVSRANELKEAAKQELNARAEVIKFIQTATQAEIKAKIEEAKQTRAINEAVANDARSVLDATRRNIAAQHGKLNLAIAEANPLYGEIGPTLQAAKDAFNQANAALSETTVGVNLLEVAAADGFAAARDLAKAEKALADARAAQHSAGVIATAQQIIDLSAKTRAEQALSVDQINARLEAAKAESAAYQFAINSLVLSGDKSAEVAKKITEYQVAIGRLGAEQARLTNTVLPLATARETEIERMKAQTAAYKEFDKVQGDITAAQTKRTDDLDAITDRYTDSFKALKAAFEAADSEAETKRLERLADLQTDTREKETDLAEKSNDEKLKIEADYQKRVTQIKSEFNRSEASATENRDAIALHAAEQKRDQELKEAEDGRDEQLKANDKQLKDELRQLQINNQRRAAEINLAAQREAQQRAAKYDYDQRQLANAQAQDIAQRNAAFNKQLADLRAYLTANNAEWSAAGNALVNYAKSLRNSITNIMNGGNSGVANGAIPVTPGTPPDLGNIFGAGGSRSFSGSTGMRSPQATNYGGFNPTFVYNGGDKAEFRRIAKVVFEKGMDELLAG